jgi:hypothetical protein
MRCRLGGGRERRRELAGCELGADIGGVARLLEQVRVDVESHARPRVAEDAADLGDVEADVDDQVAGEGVTEVVEADPSSRPVEPGVDGGPTQHPLRDVVV